MQVAKDLPAKLINNIIKSKESGETTQTFMTDYISKTIKVLANSTRKKIFLECLESPKEFDRNPLMLYHLRMLEDYGVIRYTTKGYEATNFSKELWNSMDELAIIPNSNLSIKILISLTSKPKTFIELKKNLKVNEGSVFRALNFLAENGLVKKEVNYYNITSLSNLSKLSNLVSEYVELIKNVSYDENLENIIIPKEEEIKILNLFEKEKKNYIKKRLQREEDLIKDHIIISYSYSSKSETDEIINSILKEQSGLINSKFAKPLYSFEKNMIKFGYKMNYIKTLQQVLSLLSLHDVQIFDTLMVEDISFPRKFIKSFKGPKFGVDGIRKLLNIYDRPLIQATLLPEENLNVQTVKNLSKRLFLAGIDEMCDHRTMIDDLKNFRERVEVITEIIEEIKNDYGQKIFYFHIYDEDYEERLDVLKEIKSKGIGIGLAPITMGFPLTHNIIKKYNHPVILGLILNAVFTRYAKRGISKEGELIPGFGISMNVLLKFFELLGGDEIHIDSPLYHYSEDWTTKIQFDILNYYFKEFKKPFPVLMGGITPINTLFLIRNYGKDMILKTTTSKLLKADKLGFSIERSVNAFKQAIEIATSGEKEIISGKYKDYIDSFNVYKKIYSNDFAKKLYRFT